MARTPTALPHLMLATIALLAVAPPAWAGPAHGGVDGGDAASAWEWDSEAGGGVGLGRRWPAEALAIGRFGGPRGSGLDLPWHEGGADPDGGPGRHGGRDDDGAGGLHRETVGFSFGRIGGVVSFMLGTALWQSPDDVAFAAIGAIGLRLRAPGAGGAGGEHGHQEEEDHAGAMRIAIRDLVYTDLTGAARRLDDLSTGRHGRADALVAASPGDFLLRGTYELDWRGRRPVAWEAQVIGLAVPSGGGGGIDTPEPAAAALLGAALVGLAAWRWPWRRARRPMPAALFRRSGGATVPRPAPRRAAP